MIFSLCIIFLAGLTVAALCGKLKIPRIIGMLITGMVTGPFVLKLLDPQILSVSAELRKIALIIILIKAGLSLDIADLKKVGRPALLMSFLPASFEIAGYVLFAPLFLGISRVDAAVMGAVLAAVSPAVVVPRMVQFIENRWGTEKAVPQMILAGASLDDVFVIVIFSTFSAMAMGGELNAFSFVNIPVSIVLGILLGALTGLILAWVFDFCAKHNSKIRNSSKVVLILGTSFLLICAEEWCKDYAAVSGLLAVTAMACVMKIKSLSTDIKNLSAKFGKLWIGAEVILFVLVGAAVDINYMMDAGPKAVLLIFASLAVRSLGVIISVTGTELNFKERLFCVIAYLPKATVQAAIGSVPLAMGLGCGQIVLSVAVLAIIITAPLGAFGMDLTYSHLLVKEENSLEIEK